MASSKDNTIKDQQMFVSREISRVYRYIKIGLLSARGNIRNWNDFLKHMAIPSAQAGWPAFEMRVFSNLWWWRSNYIVIATVVSFYTLVTNLNLVFALFLIGLLCTYIFGIAHMPLNLGNGVIISRIQTIVIISFLSLLILWNLNALASAIFTICLNISIILLHAALRHANVKARIAKAAQDMRMQFSSSNSDGEVMGEVGAEILNRVGVFNYMNGGESEEDGSGEIDPEAGVGTIRRKNEPSIYDDLQSDIETTSSLSSSSSAAAASSKCICNYEI
jgi:hypothetical protein